MKKNIISILILVVLTSSGLFAHSLDIKVTFKYPAVVTRCLYAADEPASNAKISVFSPSDSEKPYQTGRTDQSGYFSIIPDMPGYWIIKADDGHGHLEQMQVNISEEFLNPEQPKEEVQAEATQTVSSAEADYSKPQIPISYKIIAGLSLIIGIAGFFYGYKARQTNKQ